MESLAVFLRGNAPPISRSPPVAPEPRPLLGDFLRRPAWLWLTHVVPFALLLARFTHTYLLIADDMTVAQRRISLALALVVATGAIGAGVTAIHSQRAGRLLSDAQCAGLLALSMAALGGAVLFCWTMIPGAELEWIANRWELLSEGASLGMPGAFYTILILSARPLQLHGGGECALVLIGAWIGAVFFYGLAAVCASISRPLRLPDGLALPLAILGILSGGLLVTAALTRVTLITYTRIRRMHPLLQRGFMFVVACVGPMAGLYLNQSISFPVDLQAPVLYFLALLNGIVLMLPVVRSLFWHRSIWLAQCVLFPFSAYFFLLFLPWLPLSLFAMIAAGAGFLMLVPLVLGIAHAYRLADGFREEVRDGHAWPVALLGLCAVLLLPALGLDSAWHDRIALDEALAYLYSPDYRHDITFPGSLPALASALQHLREAKHGAFLPFLTPLYNRIVFHGLVLPDTRIDELQAAFFGEAAVAQADVFLRSRSRGDGAWPAPLSPGRDVILDDVQVTTQASGAQLLLTLHNRGAGASEFSTGIHLPEGVYVSGFALQIDGVFVPARIVERKTALWVYKKIAAARCDPGLLVYTSRTNLTLRVSPFAAGEVRQARLDLVYVGTSPLAITFDNTNARQTVFLPVATTSGVTICVTESASIALADFSRTPRWQFRRIPYLDILIDCSRGTRYTAASLARAISQVHRAFPEVTLARVTAINFEARDIVPKLIPIARLDAAAIHDALLPSRGGLLRDRFLERGLLLAHDFMQTSTGRARFRPQFILISSMGQAARHDNDLTDFLRLAPDARVIFAEDSDGQFQGEDLVSHQPTTVNAPPVHLWRWENHLEASAADSPAALTFPGGLHAATLQIYDPQRGQFIAAPIGTVIPSKSRFADGVRTWAAQDGAEFNPHLLKDGAVPLVNLSRQTGILIPSSSYVVVESAAQERAMEEKEKQKLQNNPVYELEDPIAAPEPATWLLLAFGLLAVTARAARSGARAAGASGTHPCCRPRSCRGP
jgi:hypothetical protein